MLITFFQEDKMSSGTDGTLDGNRLFTCSSKAAIFVHLNKCRPDSRFTANMKDQVIGNLFFSYY